MSGAGVIALLALGLAAGPAPAEPPRSSDLPKGQRPLLMVMNHVVDGLWPRILAAPTDDARRVSVGHGVLGIGPFSPPGGIDGGLKSPPRNLFPRVGLGNSLNVDPITGRNALTNTP